MFAAACAKRRHVNTKTKTSEKKYTGAGGPSRDDLILSDKSTMLWNFKKMAAEDAKHVRACEWVCFRDRRVIENVWEIERERWSNMSLCLIITPKALDRLRRQMPKCECVCQSVNMCVSAFFRLRLSLCVISDTCFLPPATLLYDPPPPTP